MCILCPYTVVYHVTLYTQFAPTVLLGNKYHAEVVLHLAVPKIILPDWLIIPTAADGDHLREGEVILLFFSLFGIDKMKRADILIDTI